MKTAWLAAGIIVVMVCGCAPRNADLSAAKVSPPPTPAPRLGAVADAPTFGFSDRDGNRVASVVAESGAVTGTGGTDALGELTKATATLFQKNVAVATVTADKMQADQEKRTLTATGNVQMKTVVSGSEPKGELRADRMTWRYDANEVRGTGNVLVTRGAQVRIPGTAIIADTALKTVEMTGGDAPITGTIP